MSFSAASASASPNSVGVRFHSGGLGDKSPAAPWRKRHGTPVSFSIFFAIAPTLLPRFRAGFVDGRDFALQACSVCHIVAPGQLTPPRISNAVSFRSIANTTGMNEMKLQAILSTPHAIMPNLILTPEEAADVITYVMSLRTP